MTPAPDPQARERNRAVWEAGNWDLVAPRVEPVGPRLLDRLGDLTGRRLLDIGTGSGGSVAIPAALRGADVVGSDITDAWFAAARQRAAEAGAEVDWVVGDAVALPFEDGAFDVVTSTFGHMFAPDTARPPASSCASAARAASSSPLRCTARPSRSAPPRRRCR